MGARISYAWIFCHIFCEPHSLSSNMVLVPVILAQDELSNKSLLLTSYQFKSNISLTETPDNVLA